MESSRGAPTRTSRGRTTYRSSLLLPMWLLTGLVVAWVWFSDGSILALACAAGCLIGIVVLSIPKVSIYEKEFHYRNLGFTNKARWRRVYAIDVADTTTAHVCHVTMRDGRVEPVLALSSFRLLPGSHRNRHVIARLQAEVESSANAEIKRLQRPIQTLPDVPIWKFLGWKLWAWLTLTIVLVLGGLFILVIGIGRSEVQLDRNHATTTATVVAVNQGGRSSPGSLDVTFSVEGKRIDTSVQRPYLGPSYYVGQIVKIQYLPADPTTARLAGQHDALQVGGYFLALLVFVAGGMWFSDRRDRYSKGPRAKKRWA